MACLLLPQIFMSNPWNLWMLPCLEKGFLQLWLRLLRWDILVIWVGPRCRHMYPCTREAEIRDVHRGEGGVKVEAEFELMSLQAKDCQQPPGAGKETWHTYPPRASEVVQPCQHLDFNIWPPEMWENALLLF